MKAPGVKKYLEEAKQRLSAVFLNDISEFTPADKNIIKDQIEELDKLLKAIKANHSKAAK